MHTKSSGHNHLQDTHQTWWQLTTIQLSGWMSLPTLATSILVLKQNSFLGAVLTIIAGNIILWFIRSRLVRMSLEKRLSTLDISRVYFGNTGTYLIATLLLVSTLVWFIAQTTVAGGTLTRLISLHEDPHIDQFTQMSVLLGIITAFLCMEGIVVLRKLATYSFPLLAVAFFAVLYTLPSFSLTGTSSNPLSLAGLTLVLSTNLGISSDLPTFFRHSKSRAESFKALFAVQALNIGFGLLSLLLGALIISNFEVNEALIIGNNPLRLSLLFFIFLSVICANVANVYSASVGWEILAPRALVGRKEYFILGLGLTTIFILVSGLIPTEFILTVSDISLVNLCLILALGDIISQMQKKLPSPATQKVYFAAWFISSALNCFSFFSTDKLSPLALNILVILAIVYPSLLGIRLYRQYTQKRP
jgi:cytosine permease